MKTIMFLTAGAFLALSLNTPAMASVTASGLYSLNAVQIHSVDKRSKPRIKGGSGCDDAGDAAEHPACR